MEKMGEENISIKMSEENLGKAKNFMSKYDLVALVGDANEEVYLGDGLKKVCRFCNKIDGVVTFKKKAHLIPHFMGNHNLLTHFECDLCNKHFGKLEDSLANYFGVIRTISQIKGKGNKVPIFEDQFSSLKMSVGKSALEMSSLVDDTVYTLDEENKSFTLKTKRRAYIPIHIPKMILKMAYSLLEDSDLADFDYLRRFLIDKKHQASFKGDPALKIFGYFIPGPSKFKKPFLQLWKKREDIEVKNIPTYLVLLFYGPYQYQMILPWGMMDDNLYSRNITVPIAPLFVDDGQMVKFGREDFHTLDLTSSEKKRGEDQDITFKFESYNRTL